MTILAPLIAQALGRSPYDEEVFEPPSQPGPTSSSAQQYEQQYDQRGRPVNPQTRRINRDVIRSHNEVMLAIGVVEPEASWQEAQAKAESIRRHRVAEDTFAKNLVVVHEVLESTALWGVNGMRQRILIYKQYAQSPIHQLFAAHKGHQLMSWRSYLLDGLPAMVVGKLLGKLLGYMDHMNIWWPDDVTWQDYLVSYIQIHLELYSLLQRLGLEDSGTIHTFLPNWKFFIPGTSLSPVQFSPLPSSFTPGEIVRWVGALALGVAPLAVMFEYGRLSKSFMAMLQYTFNGLVPAPVNRQKERRSPLRDITPPTPGAPAATTTTAAGQPLFDEQQPRSAGDMDRIHDDATVRAGDGQPGPSDAFPVGTVRRQSTVSGREDEFASDEEENELVRAAIISIEVGPAESASNADVLGEIRPHKEGKTPHEPIYRESSFTLLPSFLAANLLTNVTGRLLTAPLEGYVLWSVAKSYMAPRGLPLELLHGPSLLGHLLPSMKWLNISFIEMIYFSLEGWSSLALTTILMGSKVSEEEWEEREKREKLVNNPAPSSSQEAST
ncbi:hypothetical protein B0H66DRAFT_599692 [Apodospora peruviana]|uniref:Uncharacterized protein n=1 Tax=Apodospora peruviana TaxID=516989 RepID=A0AAE0II77_9PEZI|nr:hypothetical protein B0H66DRAFT_599692 [Apodospora peruviana]